MKRARAATEEVIREWEEYRWTLSSRRVNPKERGAPRFRPVFKKKLWKEIRDWLEENVFHFKCAYCETGVRGITIPDTEHFRPKSKVTMELGTAKSPDETGAEIVHPGYFWLVYNWRNLLPSCHNCNRYEGKKTYFPASLYLIGIKLTTDEIAKLKHREIQSFRWKDMYYLDPEDLNTREQPRLLHPIFDIPHEHISFDLNGVAVPKNDSQKGVESIKAFALNNKNKIGWRNEAQRLAYLDILARIALAARTNPLTVREERDRALSEYRRKPYAAAIRDYFWESTRQIAEPTEAYELEAPDNHDGSPNLLT